MTPSRKARPQARSLLGLWADEQVTHARLPIQPQDHAGPDTTISHRHNYKVWALISTYDHGPQKGHHLLEPLWPPVRWRGRRLAISSELQRVTRAFISTLAILRLVLAPRLSAIDIGCSKNCTHCYRQ